MYRDETIWCSQLEKAPKAYWASGAEDEAVDPQICATAAYFCSDSIHFSMSLNDAPFRRRPLTKSSAG